MVDAQVIFTMLGAALLSVVFVIAVRQVQKYRRAARTFRAIAESASDGMVLMERDSRVVWVNQAYCDIMGRSAEEMIGQYPLHYALAPEDRPSPEEIAQFRFDPSDIRFGKLTQRRNMRGDGSSFINEFSHAVVQDGKRTLFLLAGRDITDRLDRENQLLLAKNELETLASKDALTGLHNRFSLRAILEELMASEQPFAVLQIDLNDFKAVNDTFGHMAGDALLNHLADILRAQADSDWTIARVGGDEFTLLLPGISDLKTALTIAARLKQAARAPMAWQSGEIAASISVGAVLAPGEVKAADEVLNRGDIALYSAKQKQQRHRIAGYDTALHRQVLADQQLQRDVAQAIEDGAFTFHFQPIVDTFAHKVLRFEMLLRWDHATHGALTPPHFLPHVERLGLISEVDTLVLETACASLPTLDAAGFADVGLSINLSTSAFRTDYIPDALIAQCRKCGIPPERICIEILETTEVTLASNDAVVRQMKRLREAGFVLVLDDFGIGHAGLAHLASLTVHGIKLDRQLTSAVLTDEKAHHVVTATVDLAHKLGVDVIAEGTETHAQITAIMSAGGRYFQGFGIARPMPLDRALQWAQTEWPEWSALPGADAAKAAHSA